MNIVVRKEFLNHGVIRHCIPMDNFENIDIDSAKVMSLGKDIITITVKPFDDESVFYVIDVCHNRGWYYDKNAFSWYIQLNKEKNELNVYTIPKSVVSYHIRNKCNKVVDDSLKSEYTNSGELYYEYRKSFVYTLSLLNKFKKIKHFKTYTIDVSKKSLRIKGDAKRVY